MNHKQVKYVYTLDKMRRDGKIDFEELDTKIDIP